jgi:hypothetical protein
MPFLVKTSRPVDICGTEKIKYYNPKNKFQKATELNISMWKQLSQLYFKMFFVLDFLLIIPTYSKATFVKIWMAAITWSKLKRFKNLYNAIIIKIKALMYVVEW